MAPNHDWKDDAEFLRYNPPEISLWERVKENAQRSFLRAKRPALISHPLGRKILLIWVALAGEAIAMTLLFKQLGII
jgi:hypothetical protein